MEGVVMLENRGPDLKRRKVIDYSKDSMSRRLLKRFIATAMVYH